MAEQIDLGDAVEVVPWLGLFDHLEIEEGAGMNERACVDEEASKTSFCKVYRIHEASKRVIISAQPNESSPSVPFRRNPSLNVDFVLRSVFRGKRHSNNTATFTCFALSPPLASHLKGMVRIICATAGHCYQDDGISQVQGCLGTFVSSGCCDGAGFECSTFPLHVLVNSEVDLAFFELTIREDAEFVPTGYLLPCAAEISMNVAEFGYPCVQSSLQKAKQELRDGTHDHGLWDTYRNAIGEDSKEKLYDLLLETFGSYRTGDLLCSPGRIVDGGESSTGRLQLKLSTLSGSSGGPVLPSEMEGFFVGIHRSGRKHGDVNTATSTDSPAFVTFYRHAVLPYISEDDLYRWKDIGPFKSWLYKHQLDKLWKRGTKRKLCNVDDDAEISSTKSLSSCVMSPAEFAQMSAEFAQ